MLQLLTMRPTLWLLAALGRLARRTGALGLGRTIRELQLLLTNAGDRERRAALLRTLRAVIGRRGQTVSALDRLYLLRRVPTLVLWGTRDRMIPVHHASAVLSSIPEAELALLDGIGHMPHRTRAEFVAERLRSFINDSPSPASILADNGVSGTISARQSPGPPMRAAEASI